MKGLSILNPGGFRHTAAGLAGGSCQRDFILRVQHTVRLHDCPQNGTLTSAGAAGDDGQVVPECHFDALGLPLGQCDAQSALDLFHNRRQVDRLRKLQHHLRDFQRHLALLLVYLGQIDLAAAGHHHVQIDHGYQLLFHLFQLQRIVQVLVEQLDGVLEQPVYFDIEMSVFAAGLLDDIIASRNLYPLKTQGIEIRFSQNHPQIFQKKA